jgi:hypothetical protein
MGVTMRIQANKAEVLATIKKNRDEHLEIVAEAREGYLEKAELLLKEKIAEIEEAKKAQGRRIGSIRIDLTEPGDHTGDYNTIIRMLELHQGDTIELNSDEVRQFLENKWDWMDQFLRGTSLYSGKAAKLLS